MPPRDPPRCVSLPRRLHTSDDSSDALPKRMHKVENAGPLDERSLHLATESGPHAEVFAIHPARPKLHVIIEPGFLGMLFFRDRQCTERNLTSACVLSHTSPVHKPSAFACAASVRLRMCQGAVAIVILLHAITQAAQLAWGTGLTPKRKISVRRARSKSCRPMRYIQSDVCLVVLCLFFPRMVHFYTPTLSKVL